MFLAGVEIIHVTFCVSLGAISCVHFCVQLGSGMPHHRYPEKNSAIDGLDKKEQKSFSSLKQHTLEQQKIKDYYVIGVIHKIRAR